MKVLGLDFETQDADAKTTRVTEVGAALYEYNGKSDPLIANEWRKIEGFSSLCWEPDYPPQNPAIAELTGITDEMLKNDGKPRREIFARQLLPLVHDADIIVAHKISFDRTVLKSTAKLFDFQVPDREWLCTLTNFDWPKKLTCHKLSHLAYEHSILVDPATLHRAENDVDLMLRLLAKYDFEKVLAYAREPWVYLKAEIAKPWTDGGVQSGIAKSLGFSFERVKGVDEYEWPKKWVTRVKASRLDDFTTQVLKSPSPFRVDKIEGL